MDTGNELLGRCLERIEQVLNWGPSADWTNGDFENLSERLAAKTQVRLSVSTLKRIWGRVRYDSSPTPATLNVLARFLGYTGWRDFQAEEGKVYNTAPPEFVSAARVSRWSVFVNRLGRWPVYGVVPVVVGFLIFLVVRREAPEYRGADRVVFESRQVSDALPNSVVFTYDLGGMPADSVFIQQSWDPARRQRVSATGNTHTSLYYTPGYFEAKLIVNDSVLKEDVVFIKTKGWKGIIDGKPPVYLTEAEMRQPNGMGIDGATLRDKLGTPVFTDKRVMFSNVRDFGDLRSDAFTLDVSLRNTATVEQCLCRKVTLVILTKGGAMVIPLSAKGCISDISLLAGDEWIAGDTHDLSAFGCDFTGFERVRCVAANGSFMIYINDVLAWESAVQAPARDVVGIRISFEGTGEVQSVKLAGKDTVWLADDFVRNTIARNP